jgi:hypothetical protein
MKPFLPSTGKMLNYVTMLSHVLCEHEQKSGLATYVYKKDKAVQDARVILIES